MTDLTPNLPFGGPAGDTNAADAGGASTRAITLWLYSVAALVFVMVMVGGATRLTDSGLSITEWRPVLGIIPPLTQADWEHVFALYKQTREYQEVNAGMTLAAFKVIYWWEWSHRTLGRFIALAFLLPFLWFVARKRLNRLQITALSGLFVLGGLQGLLGWYMVQSGLADRVDVSHYRLAAHLGLACLIFIALIWAGRSFLPPCPEAAPTPGAVTVEGIALLVLIFGQIVLGGFVAGLQAGQGYNTWPLMGTHFVPDGLDLLQPFWLNAVENPIFVQFAHRILAYMLVMLGVYHAARAWRIADRATGLWALAVVGALLAQAGLGIITLLRQVPIDLALAHQAGALLVLLLATIHVQRLCVIRVARPSRRLERDGNSPVKERT